MTVNEQLRRTAQRVKGDLTDVPTPIPPSKPARRVPLALGAGLIALLAVVTVVWLGSFAPESTEVNPASGDAAMVRDWVEGALAGRFDEIASLTYGEFGEPEAMAQLAQTLHGYRAQYGEPEMTIEPFETNGGDLAFTCIAVDFGDFDVSGGIVVREWPDLGRRLWEFRNGMTGCVGESSVTTTLPALSVLSETWHYPSDAIGRYSMAAMGDFRVSGARVAVLGGDNAQRLSVLNLDTGEDLWQMDFPEHPGTILSFTNDRLMWATYERVGVHSGDGEPLWEHHFDDARWPTFAAVSEDRIVVALDPTTEGDDRPPLIVQFDEAGKVLWTAELSGANVDEDLQWADLLVADRGVIIQTTDALYRLDWETGIQEWRSPFADANVETFGVTGTMYSSGNVYAADPASEFSGREGGEIRGVDAVSGEIQLALEVGRGPRVVGVLDSQLVYSDESGLHGVNIESEGTWSVELAGAQAAIAGGRIIVASPNTLAVLDPSGDIETTISAEMGQPQLPPALVGQTVIVPGWRGTKGIDMTTGQVVNDWPGSFYSPVYQLDQGGALVGVAGDGIYLVSTP